MESSRSWHSLPHHSRVGLVYSSFYHRNNLLKQLAFLFAQGYLGDKIGYNIVLVVNLIGCALAQTAFDWTPRFYEHQRIPTISVIHNDTFQMDEIIQFAWPLQCNNTNITMEECRTDAEALYENNFWQNINQHISCNSNDTVHLNITDKEPFFQCMLI